MPTNRQRLETWAFRTFFPRHQEAMQRREEIYFDAYRRGTYRVPPQQLVKQLQESGALSHLIPQILHNDPFLDLVRFNEERRRKEIRLAKVFFVTNVNIDRAAHMWTDFGMGERVSVHAPDDLTADKVIQEFWTAERNQPILRQRELPGISIQALNEGEVALPLTYSTQDGLITIRRKQTEEMVIVWEDHDDKNVPIWYAFETMRGLVYFPDWQADKVQREDAIPKGAKLRTDQPHREDKAQHITRLNSDVDEAGTDTTRSVMLWAGRNKQQGRGLPQFMNALEWAEMLDQFMNNRATVAAKAALYTDMITVDGGSRAVADVTASLQSGLVTDSDTLFDRNPPGPAGQDWVQNEAVTRDWQTRDTGGATARFDGRMIASQMATGLGGGVEWFGFPDAIPGGLATARHLLIPWMQQIERYQIWLASIFEDMAQAALKISAENGGAFKGDYTQVKIVVSLETPITIEVEQVHALLNAVTRATKDEVIPADVGLNIVQELITISLEKFGVPKPKDLFVASTVTGNTSEAFKRVMENYGKGVIDADTAVGVMIAEVLEGKKNGNKS